MLGLLQLILSIIMGLIQKQKKETAKKVTGVSNPSQQQIASAYKKIINDIATMNKIGLQVGKLITAMKINLEPNKYASMGVRAYQESQFFLDRILGNKQEKKEFLHQATLTNVNVEEMKEYVKTYYPVPMNCFMSVTIPRPLFIHYYQKAYKLYDENLTILLEADETDYNKLVELFIYFFCNYYNLIAEAKQNYTIILNSVINEKSFTANFEKYFLDMVSFFSLEKNLIFGGNIYKIQKAGYPENRTRKFIEKETIKGIGINTYSNLEYNLDKIRNFEISNFENLKKGLIKNV